MSDLRKLSAGSGVLVAVVLAAAVALMAIEVSDWTYMRVDLSRNARNTLDPATLDPVALSLGMRGAGLPDGQKLATKKRFCFPFFKIMILSFLSRK